MPLRPAKGCVAVIPGRPKSAQNLQGEVPEDQGGLPQDQESHRKVSESQFPVLSVYTITFLFLETLNNLII